MMSIEGVVVVGAALGGISVAEALRAGGYADPVQLIDADPQPQFDRPPLSKQVLTGAWSPQRALLRTSEQIVALGVVIQAGRRAVGLDRSRKRVLLEDGRYLSYGALVIATGARARSLPATNGLSGVHVLRGMSDALVLRRAMQAARSVAVIGAGFIGTEVAAAARGYGLPVTLIDRMPAFLSRVCGSQFGAAVARMHRERGVDIRLGVGIERLIGASQVEAIMLSDRTRVSADLVVVGIGAEPNVEWLAGAGLPLSNGIDCDACGRAAPDIYAVGDVANWQVGTGASRRRIEQWSSAVEQARAVAACIIDPASAQRYVRPPPYVWSDQYGVKLQFAGDFDAARAQEFYVAGQKPTQFAALYFDGDRLQALATCDWPGLFVKGRRLVTSGADRQSALHALTG